MNIDTNVKILWLSDIHYSSFYTDENTNNIFKCFVSSFLEKCDEFYDIDYVLLSGDVAQSGLDIEYKLFFEHFLNPLFEKKNFKDTKLIFVSGNHDVLRKKNHFFEEFVTSLNEGKETRITFLNKNQKEIEKSFLHYKEAFSKYSHKLPLNISQKYKEDFLHGYFIDHQKKAIIILLNSSWYSFGDEFIKRYFDIYFNFLSFPKLDNSKIDKIVEFIIKENDAEEKQISNFLKEGIFNFFKNILQINFSKNKIESIIEFINNELQPSDVISTDHIKDIIISKKERADLIKDLINITEEYGNQVVNLDAFEEFDSLINDIETYNEYVCLQCYHHPNNWLTFNERINYNSDKEKTKFFKLQNEIDVLLTGHEHVPLNFPSDYSNDGKILTIAGGCFIKFHKNPIEFDIDNNWFSILNINTKKRNLTQYKFYASKDDNFIKWKENDNSITKRLNKKYNSKLNSERVTMLKLYIEDKNNATNIINRISNEEVSSVKGCKDYYFSNNIVYKIVNNSLSGIDTFDTDKSLFLCGEYDTFVFIFIDILFYENDYHKQKDRLEVINDIVDKIDYDFDKKRHDFFSKLEGHEIQQSTKVKFVSKIIPFWEILI